ncbi:MAG: carbohydrate-binding protein [Moraxellaceae bacterium]|nr:MAG: carbohydrate-binding protein [Moraxellaceae bacterium]
MSRTIRIFSMAIMSSVLTLSINTIAQVTINSNAAEQLQQTTHNTYISSNGKYYTHSPDSGFDFWWNANGLDALTEGYIRTRNETYKTRMKNLLHGIRDTHGRYTNDFYDDMEWLALASVKAYKATGDGEYLDVANLLWTDILTGRSPQYLNAISWNKSCHPSCKNAISNSPAAYLAAQLFRISGDAQKLQYAKEIHAYVKNKLVAPNGGVYDAWDAVPNVVNTNPGWVFSYNVGMYLAASLELYQVTSDQTYLNDAVKAAEYVLSQRMVNGVLYTNETGQGDGGLFKGIFIRSFANLAREGALPLDTRKRYADIIKYNAQILLKRGFRSDNLIGPVWNSVPASNMVLEYSTELSGIMLLEAAVSVDQVVLYQDLNFGGYGSRFNVGQYTAAQLVARGSKDNDVTSLVIPPGMQVTLFDGDNFTGASIKLTANTGWIGGDWNDRVSSMIVASLDITNLGGAISAQYPNTNGEGVDKLIDNDSGSKYLGVSGAGGWIQYQTNTAYAVNQYTITSANDAEERDPLNWTFQGSNDGTSWSTLDTRSNENFPNRYEKRRFNIGNSTAYHFYRINIVQNSGILFQLAELELFTNDLAGNGSSSSSKSSSSSSSSSSAPAFTRKIEAESYTAMNGVQLEATTDSGGGQNVGWIDANDWMAYANINFPTSGSYKVEYRVASPNGGTLSLDLNGGTLQLGQLPVPVTGGWQSWQTITQTVSITAGTYAVGVFAPQGGWNINWVRFTKL